MQHKITNNVITNRVPILTSNVADFQTAQPEPNEERHYFEVIGATLDPNRNHFQFTIEALEQLARSYAEGKTLTVNHDKFTGLGIGATTDAVVIDGELYIQTYLKKNYPLLGGSYGVPNTNALIDAVMDGFAKDVSISALQNETRCSICGNDYYDYELCTHYRGRQYIVGEGENKSIARCVIIISDTEAVELSLVQDGADTRAQIVRKVVNLHYDGSIDQETFEEVQKKYSITDEDLKKGPSFNFDGKQQPDPNDKLDQSKETSEPEEPEEPENKGANMSTEQITTLNSLNSQLTAENASLKTQVSNLETEKMELITNAAKETVEKATLTTEKDLAEKQVESLTEENGKLEEKIKELEKEAADNKLLVEDGKFARTQAEQEYLEAFVKAEGETCSIQDRQDQAEFAKTRSLSQLIADSASFLRTAKLKYPEGRQTEEGGEEGSANSGTEGNENDDGSVGY